MPQGIKKWYQTWWGILLIIITSILLIFAFAFGLFVFDIVEEIKNKQIDGLSFSSLALTDEEKVLIQGTNNYATGPENAKITIVEFGDYACPQCFNSFSKIREISTKNRDQIRYIFRDFPVIAEYSGDLAMASRCAGEQGLFWLMHDQLFLNQGVSTREEILTLALSVGVDQERFVECMDNQKYLAQIQKDFSDGDQLGITGTPTWFINGNRLVGDIPYEYFTNLINKLLE